MYNYYLTALVADQRRQQLIDEPAADRRAREGDRGTDPRPASAFAAGRPAGEADLRGLIFAD
jgi:hypothetical protein